MNPLSPKQLVVLKFIDEFLRASHFPPTRGEIAEGLGLKNRQGIDQHLKALQVKGFIELIPGVSRGLRLTGKVADNFPPQTGIEKTSMRGDARLPLLGRIAAGSPILATGNIEDHLQVDPALFTPRADFLLRVRGNSMINAGIEDHDLLVVHRTSEARNGQIVVARLEDEATVKRYSRSGNTVFLAPANPEFQTINIDLQHQQIVIEGLAVGIIRTRAFSVG
jgi:repressor LexA